MANILMTAGGLLAAAAPGYSSFLAARIVTGFAIAGTGFVRKMWTVKESILCMNHKDIKVKMKKKTI